MSVGKSLASPIEIGSLTARRTCTVIFAALLACSSSTMGLSAEQQPPDFVYLRAIDNRILQDIRYATTNNFTGKRLPGYEAGECILKRAVANALKSIEDQMLAKHRTLLVYDCYRPQIAIDAMKAWATDGDDTNGRRDFYPNVHKNQLFGEKVAGRSISSYISAKSRHNLATAVDLAIVPDNFRISDSAAGDRRPCTSTQNQESNLGGLDFGTSFDCLDELSSEKGLNHLSLSVRNTRTLLRTTMLAAGFEGYWREWWHFEFRIRPADAHSYNFPVALPVK